MAAASPLEKLAEAHGLAHSKSANLPQQGNLLTRGGDKGREGAHCHRYKGASENWTKQPLSPALIDWLARSDSDFGFELANGVLCVSRKSYLEDTAAMQTLCEEAAHLAGAIRTESEEEADSGDAQAAKGPSATDPPVEAALGEVEIEPPAAAKAASAEPQGLSAKDLDTYFEQLAGEAREDAATAPAKSSGLPWRR